ncbi:MAG: hypothetical protein QHJ81_05015 [Anaerolineae bacterium]|nr:hypothetical protein [Anaerolineae bacterium]
MDIGSQMPLLTGPWVVAGVGLCAALMVVLADWRLSLLAFAAQSVLLTMLSTRLLPLPWAALRMLVGGLVAVLWFLSARWVRWGRLRQGEGETGRPRLSLSPRLLIPLSSRLRWRGERWPLLSTVTLQRLLAVGLAGLLFFRLQGRLRLPVLPSDLALASTWLWLMGFLALALSEEPLRAGLGLLTLSAGFQLFYAALEPAATPVGLLGSLDLLLGLAIAYLMVARGLAGRPHLARRLGLPPLEGTSEEADR